jgi:hypothetical protein
MANPKPPVIIKLHPERKDYIRRENEFLRAIGLCVNTWAFVDREIYRLFRFGLHRLGFSQPAKAASILYYKQATLDRHLQLADDMLEQVLTEEEYKNEWRPLQKKVKDAGLTRNIIVHHPALRTGTAKRGRAAYLYSIHIEPYQQLIGKQFPGLKGKTALEIDDLKRHAIEVEELTRELHAFLRRMGQAHQAGS